MQQLRQLEQEKREQEHLKRQWRAHKAKGYLLDVCQNTELKAYLEKSKPKALPKLPLEHQRSSSVVAVDEKDKDVQHDESGEDACQPEEQAESPPPKDESEAETPSLPREQVKPQKRQDSLTRFLDRARAAKAAGPCGAMEEWKRRHGCPPEKRVFVCCGGYPDFTEAMLKRGWFQNPDKTSPHFDLKWGMQKNIDHEHLLPGQVVNHFDRTRDLTTKVGLTLSLRSCRHCCGVEADAFYPRAFDLFDPLDREGFVTDYKFAKAEAILREFLRHVETDAERTFSRDVIYLALKICMRLVTDVDDIIDCPTLAERLGCIDKTEWALLQQVCLDDVERQVNVTLKDSDLKELINKRSPVNEAKKEKEAEKRRQSESEKAPRPRRRSKKKVTECVDEVPLSEPLGAFDSPRGAHFMEQAKDILAELSLKNKQHTINGGKNAWIVKPSGKSRGRGIQVMRELDEIFQTTKSDGFQWVIQKYIEQPQLVHGYKFDIRQWVLVTEWNPLTIYIWRHPYLRFAGQKYDESMADRSEFVHLTNNSIIHDMEGFHKKNDDLQMHGYMWFRQQYEAWLHEQFCSCESHYTPWLTEPPYTCESFGVKFEEVFFVAKDEEDEEDDEEPAIPSAPPASAVSPPEPCSSRSPAEMGTAAPTVEKAVEAKEENKVDENAAGEAGRKACENLWETCIKKQIEDIVTWSLSSVVDSVQHRKNTVELFGYDFMISAGAEKPEVWLIEVNSSPACDYSTPVTCPLVKKMMEDTAKVMVDLKEDAGADTGEWELLLRPMPKTNAQRIPMGCSQLEVRGHKMKLPKKRKKKAAKTEARGSDDEVEGGDGGEGENSPSEGESEG